MLCAFWTAFLVKLDLSVSLRFEATVFVALVKGPSMRAFVSARLGVASMEPQVSFL